MTTVPMFMTAIGEPTQYCPSISKEVRTDQTENLCRAQHGCHLTDTCPLESKFQSYDLGVLSDASFVREG